MRLNASTDEEARHYIAKVDGVEVPCAIWADEEAGEVMAIELAEDGKHAKLVDGELVYTLLRGKVTLERK